MHSAPTATMHVSRHRLWLCYKCGVTCGPQAREAPETSSDQYAPLSQGYDHKVKSVCEGPSVTSGHQLVHDAAAAAAAAVNQKINVHCSNLSHRHTSLCIAALAYPQPAGSAFARHGVNNKIAAAPVGRMRHDRIVPLPTHLAGTSYKCRCPQTHRA